MRALTGSQPPDEEARKGEEPEWHEPPICPPAAVKGEHHPDGDDEQEGAGDGHAALGRLGRLTGLALVGDQQDGGQVGEDARATQEGERHGADPHEDGVDVEVLRDAAADAADDAIAACAVEPAWRGGAAVVGCSVVGRSGPASRGPECSGPGGLVVGSFSFGGISFVIVRTGSSSRGPRTIGNRP